MSLADWHQRYLQQAGWTRQVRRHLFAKANLPSDAKILEVGCGTGAVLSQVAAETSYELTGIDIDRPCLAFIGRTCPKAHLAQADGQLLPFANGSFDAVYCHYLLLWVDYSVQVLREMRRVTKPGGAVMALAEPDHAARIDAPPPLDELGRLQTDALAAQGANVHMGRSLRQVFSDSGLKEIESALLGAEWLNSNLSPDPLEWMTLRADLNGILREEKLSEFEAAEGASRKQGIRVLFIPTFYALGFVP